MKNKLLFNSYLFFAIVCIFASQLHAADYTNSIGMKFKTISAGSFYMGSCKLSRADKKADEKRKFMGESPQGLVCPSGAGVDNNARDSETPQHEVRISKSFQIGIYEVTLGQFKKFIVGAGRNDLLTDDFIKCNQHGNNAAVCFVSWDDAQSFIEWLNRKEGGNRYRLPTEAEWEYAARAGTITKYSWGDSANQAGDFAWYLENAEKMGNKYGHDVGQKRPNPWGLYDMHGNVFEWVQDWFSENYYRNSPTTDPQGCRESESRRWAHTIRGGGGVSPAKNLRSASRGLRSPDARVYFIGFRLLRTP